MSVLTFESILSKLNSSSHSGPEYCSPDKTDDKIIDYVFKLMECTQLLPRFNQPSTKSVKASEQFRTEGNKAFLNRNDMKAIREYTSAIGHAPANSEQLALAYGNRSACTFAVGELDHCLRDIEMALAIGYPNSLKYKLLDRKGKSLLQQGSYEKAAEALRFALDSLLEAGLTPEKETKMKEHISRTLLTCVQSVETNEKLTKHDSTLPALKLGINPKIESASCAIDINDSEEMGRHIIATCDIRPGDVLAIEKPYASVLLPTSYTNHCFNCKKRCHSLIPCETCTRAFFCSCDCLDRNHIIECSLLPALLSLGFHKMELLATRTLLEATRQGRQLNQLLSGLNEIDQLPGMKGFKNGKYPSDDYISIHHLERNRQNRTCYDTWSRAIRAICILEALDKCSDFFKKSENDIIEDTKFPVMLPTFEVVRKSQDEQMRTKKILTGALLLRYLQSMPCNAHEVSEMCVTYKGKSPSSESTEIGGAVYPFLSLINHSCDPNVVRHSHCGDAVVLTAIQVIRAGEQIFDNYGFHHAVHSLEERRTHLSTQYYFNCHCIACTENWPLYTKLPDKVPTYLACANVRVLEERSAEFKMLLKAILEGDNKGKLPLLYEYLYLLHCGVRRPWKEYSECQETIKQCLSMEANHYIIYRL